MLTHWEGHIIDNKKKVYRGAGPHEIFAFELMFFKTPSG
jgi:hypothetical protein